MAIMRAAVRLLVASVLMHCALAAAQTVPESELKAAFIFNFALFTDWPADTAYEGGLFHVCVGPASILREPLSAIVGKTVRGRRLTLRTAADPESLRACQVLVIEGGGGAGARERWAQTRKALDGASVLTVTDDENIAREGAVVGLATEGQRLAFDIDLKAARQARLMLSSKLLRLARTVN